MSFMKPLTRGQLAKTAGVKPETIRFTTKKVYFLQQKEALRAIDSIQKKVSNDSTSFGKPKPWAFL